MKIGEYIKGQLKDLGYDFSINDTISHVNNILKRDNQWVYVGMSDYGLAIFTSAERGA